MADPRAGRRSQPSSTEAVWLAAIGALVVVVIALGLWVLGASIDPNVHAASLNPVELIADEATGRVGVGAVQVLVLLVGLAVLAGVAFVLVKLWRQVTGGARSRVDHLAREMSRSKDYAELEEAGALRDAERLHSTGAGVGVPLAKLVNNRHRLYASWEWVQIWLMGPRAGKTTCVCVPQLLETQGPALATSNKRDLVDMTRGPRARVGTVWVHDVQGIIGEEPAWWWNPLSFVTDMETAERLTDVFITSATDAGAKQDAYFASDGKRLLSHMFYAAAIAHRPITDVFTWAQDPNDKTPRNLLLEAGQSALAKALGQIQNLTEKQRDGVYGTMRPWITVLSYEKVIPWITNETFANRPELDHTKLATSTDTLYLISREGPGSARAITAALAMAVMSAAEQTAARLPGGRLPTPMMAVLDEAANVVRWRDLPDVYSHYGSRGLIVSTFFQSYQQGVEAFGEHGMAKLWGASNIRVAGSGLSDDKFLPFLSQLIGDHDVRKRQTSSQSKGGGSVTSSLVRERVLDVNDLAALPRGRAIMTSSGLPAGLIELEHYSSKPYAQDVKASQTYYESQVTGQT